MREPTRAHAAAVLLVACAFPASGRAEASGHAVSGVVRDVSGRPVAGATVVVDEGAAVLETGPDGRFTLTAEPGEHTLGVSRAGYRSAARPFTVGSDPVEVEVTLAPAYRVTEEVVVQAIRAHDEAPVTKSDLDAAEIERLNHGQEMPFLLKTVPSVTQYSDNGLAAGYSYFYLRGIQQTRINMTLDGVPLNEPEDSALYFADFGDFASALSSIQVQRGVGTSTVGSASYGGSVNFASVDVADEAELTAQGGGGSFGSRRGAVAAHSGPLGASGLALYGRASFQETDGFRRRSGVRQRTFFFGASWKDERSLLKVFGFSGLERTQLSFLATEKSVLEGDLRANDLAPEERDRFGQTLVHGQYTRFFGGDSSLALQAYYNGAGGWYRLWDDPVARTALREYRLDWRLLGLMLTFRHEGDRLSLTGGVHANDFGSDHARDVVGAGNDYANSGSKNEASGFAKLGYDAGRWHLYADAQVRWARFRYEGRQDLGSVSWTFFNPKLGARFALSPGASVYASLGRATREPARSDMLAGEDDASLPYDLRAVRPERVVDLEAGVEIRGSRLRARADVYAMDFRNEIALTGELSEIGLPLRRNVPRSRRRGVELEATYQPWRSLRFTHAANASRSRIGEWRQFYDVYDPEGVFLDVTARVHRNVPPLLTPGLVLNQGVEWTPGEGFSLGLLGRYVSRAHLDNTDRDDLTTPSFFTLEASGRFDLSRWIRAGRPRLRVQVNNLLDNRRIWPSGYSYPYLARDASGGETAQGIAYYYPQATRSVFVTLEVTL